MNKTITTLVLATSLSGCATLSGELDHNNSCYARVKVPDMTNTALAKTTAKNRVLALYIRKCLNKDENLKFIQRKLTPDHLPKIEYDSLNNEFIAYNPKDLF